MTQQYLGESKTFNITLTLISPIPQWYLFVPKLAYHADYHRVVNDIKHSRLGFGRRPYSNVWEKG